MLGEMDHGNTLRRHLPRLKQHYLWKRVILQDPCPDFNVRTTDCQFPEHSPEWHVILHRAAEAERIDSGHAIDIHVSHLKKRWSISHG